MEGNNIPGIWPISSCDALQECLKMLLVFQIQLVLQMLLVFQTQLVLEAWKGIWPICRWAGWTTYRPTLKMGNQSFRNQCEIRYEMKLIGILNFLLCSIFKRTKQSMYFTVYKYLFIFNIYKHCHIWPMSEWIVYFTFTVVCLERKFLLLSKVLSALLL